ncbi:hypothetical protein NQ318_022760 [Aromia moschata]|uniref:Uncharacterized protein n=1 Tax=Aromia moschata TaxID=1265417 RepID=A0AAV8YE32_9CUCU|nr:hypothetical protein NQ318_022760 [Aromia moschata]
MATSNTYPLTSESFKMPSEPCPLPSLGSDEESFVVLWKDMDSKSLLGDDHEPIGTSVVEEAKQLINKELSQLDQANAIQNQMGSASVLNNSENVEPQIDSSGMPPTSNMEQSTALPKMPQVERGFLKKENFNLTRDMEELVEKMKLQENDLIALRQTLKDREQQANEKLAQSADNNLRAFDLEIANKKMKELELAIQKMTQDNANLRENNATLTMELSKIDGYEKEIENLQHLLHCSKTQMEESKMELLKVKSLEEERQKSLNGVIENLRHQLSQQQAIPVEDLTNMRQQLTNTQIMLTQVEHTRTAAYVQIEALNREVADLKRKLQESHSQTTKYMPYKHRF